MYTKYLTILLLLLISTSGFTQRRASHDKVENAISSEDDKYFASDDPDVLVTEIPEKWKNESAVILYRKYYHSFWKFERDRLIRVRIKLIDQQAIDNFSIFYYPFSTIARFGIKIIKPDGTTELIDLSASVGSGSDDIPDYFTSRYITEFKKIAIPNLTKGDILDYYYVSKYNDVKYLFYLPSSYPILKQKFEVLADKHYNISFRTFNTDIEVQEGPNGSYPDDKKGKPKDHIKTYYVEDENREPTHSEYWKLKKREIPNIKIEAYKYPIFNNSPRIHIEQALNTAPFDLEYIQDKYTRGLYIKESISKSVMKEMKKNQYLSLSDNELAIKIYYECRKEFTKDKITDSDEVVDLTKGTFSLPDKYFTHTFSKILTELYIPHKLVVAVKRSCGSFENVLFQNELSEGIKVGDMYFFTFSNFTLHNNIPSELLGANAIEFDFECAAKVVQLPSFDVVTIPTKTYKDNEIKKTYDVSFAEYFETTNITIHNSYKGIPKNNMTGDVVYQFNYLLANNSVDEDAKRAEVTTNKKRNQARDAQEIKKLEALKKEQLEKKFEHYRSQKEDDFEVKSYNSFEILSVGRDQETPLLLFDEELEVTNLVNKAGENHMLKVGLIIGKQLELQKDDLIRTSDIHLNYAKSYIHIINITIPEGYSIQGHESLNTNIVNEIGEFTCVSTYENNVLKLVVSKLYKVQDSSKDNWDKYVAFLDGAYDFTQKKVLLKKVQ